MLSASQLRERITIQAPTSGSDSWGQPAQTWTNVATSVPAKVSPIRARESDESRGVAIGQVVFTVRFRSDLNETMRIVWRDVAYAITGFPADVAGKRRDLEIMGTRTPLAGEV